MAIFGTIVPGETFNFRNRIINGDMRIDQRNAGASVTVNAANLFFAVDRFQGRGEATDGVFTIQRSTTAPVSFTNSLLATVTTADASIGSSQLYFLRQNIEGFNVADLNFGSANAKTITLSFWVRSSVTGTFSGALQNGGSNRSYPFTYTISSANTFEYKTITIAGDTTGTWLTDNSTGLRVYWSLGAGSSNTTTANAWAAGEFAAATGSTDLISTNGATFYITGVQLEVGSVATPFERRPFGTELALCQRYYQQIGKINNVSYQAYSMGACSLTTNAVHILQLPVTMRAAPTFTFNGATNTFVGVVGVGATAVAVDISSPITIMYNVTVASGLTVGQASRHYQNATSASSLELSAEL